ncbi:MAG TPA: cobalt transporter CbiM [Planctomycetaceae bacterium]|nr:cobalt transporter CbiM [Planctomycetaceae bacterium]
MHLEDGVLSVTPEGIGLLVAGAAATAAGTWLGLRRLDYERMPQVAMFSAAFFVASLIHVSFGVTSAHLVLNGLVGLMLGWTAFPAILVGLLLQAVLFGFGGPATLGINTLVMALPAVGCHWLFRQPVRSRREVVAFAAGFAAGALALLGSGMLTAGVLVASHRQFRTVAQMVFALHLPVACVEGAITGSVVVFLRKVRPELLDAAALAPSR